MTVLPKARQLAAAAVLVLLPGGALSGCGSTVTDSRAGSRVDPGPSTPAASPVPYCPAPEAGPAPSPCISYDERQRYAENHAYRQEMPLPDGARSAAAPSVQALRTALQQLAGGPLDEDAVRRAAAQAAGVRPATVRVEVAAAAGRAAVVVEVATGCLHGTISGGTAAAELTGFIADGGCFPAAGH
ncbi:precorrin-3B C(17)-methyltransferase [Kitasatospora sp. NPDC059571]|uniref:precorrin-3B C(17)-methyltransferase n=1 Tax=Kitasatospora sp. NPDC059571 TaxID=3346871 RepID=UPI0036954460